jgi:LPXTG-site transpeptidase (sortase) family protein
MLYRGVVRSVGALLVVAGLLVLAYAVYSYAQASLAEREAEAHIPGQAAQTMQETPPVVLTLPKSSATHSASPTMPEKTGTPTRVTPPTLPAQPTEPLTTKTSTVEWVIGKGGLPRGAGADPTRLIIPRLKLDSLVEEATWAVVDENGTGTAEWQIPFDAVGHLSTTPKPGEAGNAVISGHHNLIGPNTFGLGKFAGLWNLQLGDPVYSFDRIGRIFEYRVTSDYVLKELGEPLSVREQHAQQILRDDGTPIITFETCWNGAQAPLSGNTYRWIVVANLVGTVFSEPDP